MSKERLIGFVNGIGIYCDLANIESTESTLLFLETETKEKWSVFKESYGNKNLVIYNESMFETKKDHLHFKGGRIVDLPLNCSSTYKMFADIEFKKDFKFRDFDMSCIADVSYMFENAILSDNFVLPDKFKIPKSDHDPCLFCNCRLPNNNELYNSADSAEIVYWLNNRK